MIDLHTHTCESDGTFTPQELFREAARIGVTALAITDHDTFAGYDQAVAISSDIDLICGIELSTKYQAKSIHLLAYFLNGNAPGEFRDWVAGLIASRERRNRDLVDRLRMMGVTITMEELRAAGNRVIGRPHFAAILVKKGYVSTAQEAFDRYLAESGSCFVPRDDIDFSEAVARVLAAGGLPVLAHPGRVSSDPSKLAASLEAMCRVGLRGLEVFHSEHTPEQEVAWEKIARERSLAITGGSDFHGAAKPDIALGTGIRMNLNVPPTVLAELLRPNQRPSASQKF